jgi:hypothetical protein
MPRPHLSIPVRSLARAVPREVPVEPVIRHISDRRRAGPGGVDHPLVVGRVFLLLPTGFLDALADELGAEAFDPDTWALERRLAGGNAASDDGVGVIDGRPLIYTYLFARKPIEVPPELQSAWGWSPGKAAQISALVEGRGRRFRGPARGYCGWLLTNPLFLAEHDQLLGRWADEVFDHWLPPLAGSLPRGPSDAAPPDMAADFAAFHARWRLAGLAAPYLPLPLAPQVPALGRRDPGPTGGVTIFLPDTFPVPSRDELRDAIEDALRGASARPTWPSGTPWSGPTTSRRTPSIATAGCSSCSTW